MDERSVLQSKPYFSFRGIRYGTPPLRTLRFKPPQMHIHRPDGSPINALEFGNVCVQADAIGSEDCLFINVYTPSVEWHSNLPVVIVIHDGGFTEGSGNAYAPDFLLNQDDIVVVTFNYRLGPFGFLSLDTPEHPGNVGLKDQLLALRWTFLNIYSFGGDSNQITLHGFGAGSVSAHLHVLSQESRKFFQRAILVGGVATNPWAISQESQLPMLMQFAIDNGQPLLTQDFLIDYLENVDPYLLASQTNRKLYIPPSGPKKVTLLYTPRVEPVNAIAQFIFESPFQTISNGNYDAGIPMMFGVAYGESYPFIEEILREPSNLAALNERIDMVLPLYPLNENLHFNSEQYKVTAQQIRKFYFNDSVIDSIAMQEYSHLMSDMLIAYGLDWSARQHAQQANAIGRLARVYYYRLSVDTDFSLAKSRTLARVWNLSGASQGDEYFYTFGATDDMKAFYTRVPIDSVEWRTVNSISKMYTNFIRFENPMVDSRPVFFAPLSDWNFMDIQNDLMQPSRVPHNGSPIFWDNAIEEYLQMSTSTPEVVI